LTVDERNEDHIETPLEELSSADRFFRALLLGERGEYAAARGAQTATHLGLYTQEYLVGAAR